MIQIDNLVPSELNENIIGILDQLSPTKGIELEAAREILQQRINNNHYTYCIKIQGHIVAIGSLFLMMKLAYGGRPVGLIEDVVVDKAFRKNGYGEILVRYLVKTAKQMNCYKVILNCSDEVSDFYKKCDFIKTGNQMSIRFKGNN